MKRKSCRFCYLFLFHTLIILGIFTSHFCEAAVWYVKPDGSDANTGQNWNDAFQTIQAAVDAAHYISDEIWIQQGSYRLQNEISIFNKSIALYGGFSGNETVREQRDWRNHLTYVEGGGAIDHCFYIDRTLSWVTDVVIDGFTITGGYADGGSEDNRGGGIFIDQVPTIITNCTFSGNTATADGYGGGAIYIDFVSGNAPVIITNCIFSQNSTSGSNSHGGAIYANSSNPVIDSSLFIDNQAEVYGGAVFINGDEPSIKNSTFYGNSAYGGGAIYNANGADPIITNSIFWGNNAADELQGHHLKYDIAVGTVSYCTVENGGTPGTTWFQNGADNSSENPLFVDAAGGDFHLMPDSPCVDTGNSAVASADGVDIDGNERIIGSSVDRGTDESFRAWYVDAEAAPSGHGGSWSSAFNTLSAALAAAEEGHQIWVKKGTYTLSGALLINLDIDIYGGFNGSETSPQRTNYTEGETIIDGQGLSRCFNYSSGGNGHLDGFSIQNGNAGTGGGSGGGILISGASPLISNTIIRNNAADSGQGGGIAVESGAAPVLVNVVMHDNSAVSGGGLASSASSPQIINTTLFGNSADSEGGAVWNSSSDTLMTNSIIWDNTAPTGPGFFMTGSPSALISYSDIQGWLGGGTGNIDTEPFFRDPENGDFHLQTDSPCIDQGDNSCTFSDIAFDIDGEQRIHDGDEDTVATVDMGADEYLHTPVIWHVDGSLESNGDGTTWATAFNTIEAAFNNPLIRDFDQIWVREGRYSPPQWGDWGGYDGLKITKAIGLYGGFPGTVAEPDWTDRNWDLYPTILDADTPDNSSMQRCIQIVNEISTIIRHPGYPVIDGLTLTRGDRFYGGAVYSNYWSPTISNCKIIGNIANEGGGIYIYQGYPNIYNNVFAGNSADSMGAALSLVMMSGNLNPETPQARIISNTFTENAASEDISGSSTVWMLREYENGYAGEFANNIFWNNALPPNGVELFLWNNPSWTSEAGNVSIHHNIIENGSELSWFDNGTNGMENMDGNPWFHDPDGPDDDPTTFADNDYRPTSHLSINRGDGTAVPADRSDLDGDGDSAEPVPFDLAKRPRFSGLIDIGAYEPIDTDGDSVPDIIDGAPAEAIVAGDFDNSGGLPDLADLITVLQTLCASTGTGICFPQADTNGDQRLGMEDCLYILREVTSR